MTAKQELETIEKEFPKLAKMGMNILSGKIEVPDNIYRSTHTDIGISTWNYNSYFQVKDNKIVAIGEERGRDGGWYWFTNHQ